MAKGPKDWSPRPPDTLALEFEDAVRQVFVDVYGPPEHAAVVERSIRSSYLPEGKKLGWAEPDPTTVVILTEFGWVHDPYLSKEDHEKWDSVARLLQERGWRKATWDSVNPAVQAVYFRPYGK